jgi:PAS domain S-box-containing protein
VGRSQEHADKATSASLELERSGPVFDRARRLAGALFGGGAKDADIVLVEKGMVWRSSDPQGRRRLPTAQGSQWVVEHGELLWVEDISRDANFSEQAAAYGQASLRLYVAAPIRLDDGAVPGVLVVGRPEARAYDPALAERLQDLADFVADEWTRVRATRARDAANGTLASIVASAPLSLALTDRDMRLIHASPTWLEERALTAEQAIGQSLYELAPEVFAAWRKAFDRCLKGRTLYANKAPVPRPDGGTSWLQARVAPWRDGSGEVGGLIMVAHDLTQVFEAMERTARSEERLKLAAESARLYVWALDYRRREISKVGREEEFFETPQSYEDVLGDPWTTIDPRDRPAVIAGWEQFIADGVNSSLPEYRIHRSDGKEIWVTSAISRINDADGEPLRFVGALHDITKRKQQERALIQAKEEAEAANRAKSTFLATVSHEIRTPLNGLLGMAHAMANGPLEPMQRDRLEIIRQSGEGLLSILNEVLDLSKIEAGKLTLEDGEFDVAELARGTYATFQAVAENKGLAFQLRVLPGAGGAYRGDPLRVRQILSNLVSNALKFTDRGAVKIVVGRRAGLLHLQVKDTGVGMSVDQQQRLFQAFEQAETSTSRRYGGTGLGLAICRDLCELMHGRIRVRSRPGAGASFTVSLPLAKLQPSAETSAEPAVDDAEVMERPLRVLAAEDNNVNQLVLKTLLNQVGIEPVMVGDGRAVIEAWAREPWDLILMDVQMPLMDGPAATAEIRARERIEGRARTPILALTANALDDQVADYLAAGMDGFVAKPIAASRLFAALQAALVRPDAPGAEAAA